MKELTTLKKLAESAVPSSEARARQVWFNKTDTIMDQLEARILGTDGKGGATLKKMLADGKFPETESKAMQAAFSKFFDEYEDFKMALLIDTEE